MPKCEDCDTMVVWLRKPDGGWLPPVEPILDFADAEHFTATIDGIAQPMPQVYRKHQCLTWEERQRKLMEKERERQELIRLDRERRAEEQRIAQELEDARQAALEERKQAEAELARRERERAAHARRATERRDKRQVVRALESAHQLATALFRPQRLLPIPCRDCGAVANEPCRDLSFYNTKTAHMWWQRTPHNARFVDGPPADRRHSPHSHYLSRWDEDYDPLNGKGTTPETCGPWPPDLRPTRDSDGRFNVGSRERLANGAGAYDMQHWLRDNYLAVFEPDRYARAQWQAIELTWWLKTYGDIFDLEEGDDSGPDGVAEQGASAGAEGVRERDAELARREEGAGDRVDSERPGGMCPGDGEQADRREGDGEST